MKRKYPAILIQQTEESNSLVLFAANTTEIDEWSGIPQRERLGGDETVGFQREEDPKRLKNLSEFYSNSSNVIQNPLLCASREGASVMFTSSGLDEHGSHSGELEIEYEDLSPLPLLDILRRLKGSLEERLADLATQSPSDRILARLRERANEVHPDLIAADEPDDEDELPEADENGDSEDAEVDATSALFSDETHIADFWEEVAGRIQVLEELGVSFEGGDFLGFSKDAMIAYLQPVVIVDGQHRLRGALLAADNAANAEENRSLVEKAIEDGRDPDDVRDELRRRHARVLPVSILLNATPAEQVFQFVVVNQKATPIGKALLGTIVSTSLTAEELSEVSERLKSAGIPLEDSQAIAFLTRYPDSPFRDLVQKGMSDDEADLLQWNVLGSLARIFRDLKGGKLYHERLDYADKWRRDHLDSCELVSSAEGTDGKMRTWAASDGPWREVFMRFYAAVRDHLGTTSDPDAGNFWGAPRKSNLFNKVSLTILAADFFQYLCDRGYGIKSLDDVEKYVDEWLTGVNSSYFSRDWRLTGVKKDAPGTRAQWSSLWVEYRKDPVRLPTLSRFRSPKGA